MREEVSMREWVNFFQTENSKINQISQIAEKIRIWAEDRARIENRDQSLCGFCAIASAQLNLALNRAGIKNQIEVSVYGPSGAHVFITHDDLIIDVTATQFGISDRVYIRHHREVSPEFYTSHYQFSTVAQLKKYQVTSHWPINQLASTVFEVY